MLYAQFVEQLIEPPTSTSARWHSPRDRAAGLSGSRLLAPPVVNIRGGVAYLPGMTTGSLWLTQDGHVVLVLDVSFPSRAYYALDRDTCCWRRFAGLLERLA